MRAVPTRMMALMAMLCVAGLVAWAAQVVRARTVGAGHTYTIAEVQAALARHTDEWRGRTIRVRGVVRGCIYGYPGLCASWQPELRQPQTRPAEAGAGLLLVPDPARPDALTALLRRIPWVRTLVRSPQAVQWGVAVTYRVQLEAVAGSHCGDIPCYEGLLVDAAP